MKNNATRCGVCTPCLSSPPRPCRVWVDEAIKTLQNELASPALRRAISESVESVAERMFETEKKRRPPQPAPAAPQVSDKWVRITRREYDQMRQDIADMRDAYQTIFVRCQAETSTGSCGRMREKGIVCPGAARHADGSD